MYEFEFVKPASLAEAKAILSEDEEAKLLAGGQTLIPTLKQRLAMPTQLVSLSALSELQGISIGETEITIGASVTHARVASEANAYPALAQMASGIGDFAVRNRGTLGGSVANNDPSACYPAAVLGSGATIVTDTREIPADDFFDGMFTTVLEEDEIVAAVRFPIPEKAGYVKFKQPASHFALAGVFVAKFADAVRVAVTGASEEGVFRWNEAEAALATSFNIEALDGLTVPADGMLSDVHGDAEYRAHLVGVMAKRAVAAAV